MLEQECMGRRPLNSGRLGTPPLMPLKWKTSPVGIGDTMGGEVRGEKGVPFLDVPPSVPKAYTAICSDSLKSSHTLAPPLPSGKLSPLMLFLESSPSLYMSTELLLRDGPPP